MNEKPNIAKLLQSVFTFQQQLNASGESSEPPAFHFWVNENNIYSTSQEALCYKKCFPKLAKFACFGRYRGAEPRNCCYFSAELETSNFCLIWARVHQNKELLLVLGQRIRQNKQTSLVSASSNPPRTSFFCLFRFLPRNAQKGKRFFRNTKALTLWWNAH